MVPRFAKIIGMEAHIWRRRNVQPDAIFSEVAGSTGSGYRLAVMRILVLAGVFPPRGGPGAIRYAHLCHHWARAGHEVDVVSGAAGWHRDERLLHLLDEPLIRVHRTERSGAAQLVWGGMRARLKDATQEVSSLPAWARMARFARDRFAVPDVEIASLPRWTSRILQLMEMHRFDALLTTSYPYSSHLAGRFVRMRTAVPWFMELRDPWAGHVFRGRASGVSRWIDLRLERWCIEASSGVSVIAPRMADDLRARYPGRADSIVVIPNGFEPVDDPGSPEAGPRWRLSYTGTFDTYWEPVGPLCALFDLLFARAPHLRSKIHIDWAGSADVDSAAELRAFMHRHPGVWNARGQIPFSEVASVRARSHALLLTLAPGAPVFTTKLLEYLDSERPIIAIVGPGDCRDLLERAGNALCVDPQNLEVALPKLASALEKRAIDFGRRDRSTFDPFRYAAIAERFTQYLNPGVHSS